MVLTFTLDGVDWLVSSYCRFIPHGRATMIWVGPEHSTTIYVIKKKGKYKGRTESHEQLFLFACELGTSDEGECGGRWNQLLCYP